MLALALTWLLAGCALFPSQIGAPKRLPYSTTDERGQKVVVSTWLDAQKYADDLSIPLVVERKELRSQINVYAAFWTSEQGDLLLERDIAGRGRDGAVLLAAYHAVKSQLKQARYSGLAAVLFGSYSDTYQVEVQAKNYMTAGKMMVCVGQAIDKVPMDAWASFNTATGEFTDPAIEFPSGTVAENLAILNDTFPAVNRTMNRILWRLIEDQRSLKLSGVNLESLRAAYDKEKATLERATNPNNVPAMRQTTQFLASTTTSQQSQTDLAKARVLALKLLPSDAEKCLGAGGA